MKMRVKLTYPQDMIKEPLLFRVAKEFDVLPNIRRARVTETVGEIVLELEGEEKSLQDGMAFLKEKGVQVELIEGDVIE